MSGKIMVTGALGNVGRETIGFLLRQGEVPVAADFDLEKLRIVFGDSVETRKIDFVTGEGIHDVFRDVRKVFLMRPPAISDVKRYMFRFVDAAIEQGVKHFVLLSLQGAEKNPAVPHRKLELYLLKKGVAYTFLRPTFFMQNLSTTHAREIRERDEIYVPAGKGKTTFVDVRDIAEVAALCLCQSGHEGRAYELTGSESVTYEEIALMLTNVLGRGIIYKKPGAFPFLFRKLSEGLKFEFAVVMTALYSVSRFGLAGKVTKTVQEMTGHHPGLLKEFIERNRSIWMR